MAGRPRKIEFKDDKKKGAFEPATFDVIRTKLAPMVGGNVNYAVKLAADYVKANGKSDLSAIDANEVLDALKEIAATHKPQEGEDDERGGVDIKTLLNDAAVAEFDRKDQSRWNRKFRVGQLVEYLTAKGYGEKNLASPEVVDAFVAETEKLVDRKVDGPENSVCAFRTAGLTVRVTGEDGQEKDVEVQCISDINFRFTPVSEQIMLRDRSLLSHREGDLAGKPVRNGSYMVNRAEKVGPVCPRCVSYLVKNSDRAIRFFDSARADEIVAGIQTRRSAQQGLAALAGDAASRRRRPPVQSGARNMPGQWTTRRNRGDR